MVLNIEIPYPSIADIFWLSGYVPLFIALLLYVQLFKPAISARMFFVSGVIVACVSAVAFPLLMLPVLTDTSQQDFLTLSISFAYPSLDLVLSEFRPRLISRSYPWTFGVQSYKAERSRWNGLVFHERCYPLKRDCRYGFQLHNYE